MRQRVAVIPSKSNRAVLTALFLGAVAGPSIAAPAAPAKHPVDRMFDARVNAPESFQKASAARPGAAAAGFADARSRASAIAAAITNLSAAMPGLEVQLSNLTGAPESVLNKRGSLTDAAPGRRSEDIVREFLGRQGALYGLSADDLSDLVALGDSAGGSSGLRMLRMEQQIDGRPVFQSETRFLLDRDGRLVKSLGRIVPAARALAPAASAGGLTAAQAIVSLLASEGRVAQTDAFTVTGPRAKGVELAATDAYVAGPITAREVLFPLAPGLLVRAWSLVVFTHGDADWYAMVDQDTGALLWRKNIRNSVSNHDARFRVYVQADGTTPADSPAPASPNTFAVGSGTQAAAISPTVVSMHTAMDATASPNGWIDDCPGGVCTANETQTLGNNVLACLDRIPTGSANDNVCDTDPASVLDGNGRPTGNPDTNSRNRDFLGTTPRDFETNFLPAPQGGNPDAGQTATGDGLNGTLPVDQFRRGVVTHLFYVTNWYHDQLFKLGFDEASGNFQQTNFTASGFGNDRIKADVQDGSGTDNANFSTPPDGTSGHMQMYVFPDPPIARDGALDAEVSMHEMTHGTSNRLVGNGAGLNWDPAAGMGEGWSDFYALSLLNNTNADDPNGRYASGAYATYKFLTPAFTDNYVYGIRRFPYSTDNTVNPLTWADVDDVTNNVGGGIAPGTLTATTNANGAMEVHNVGEIWALSLWEVRSRVIADPAGANGDVPTGNHTMLQLVTDALKMTPVDPSFIAARDAIIDADCATHACANEASIWAGFADRGLGYGAKAPYNIVYGYRAGHIGVHESFSVPFLDVVNPATDVTIDDSASNNNGAIDPGEAVKLTIKLTNPWRAASKAVTAGTTATLTTTTPGVTIYDGTSTYGAIAPQGTAVGDTFMLTVAPTVVCGSAIDFTLTTTSSLGTTAVNFRIRVGAASGTDPVVTYTGTPAPALAIPDRAPRGVFHQLNVTDDFQIADVNFRADSVTHTFSGDLTLELRSPDGIGTDFISLIGGVVAGGGAGSLTNMVVDDDVAVTAGNDMVQAASAAAPYTKSWLPVFNGPWPPLGGFPTGPDVVGNLSRFDGKSTQGTWTVLVSDQLAGDTGTLNAWSMLVTPVHFSCAAFTPMVVMTATKTVAGTFEVGGTVTYTVVLTNNGTGNQADNSGAEFTDTLPASLTLVNATATSGTAGTSGNTVTWNGSLAPLGGTTTITITATINLGTGGTTISNQGTVRYDADVNGSNESMLLTDDPAVGGASDPTSFTVAVVPAPFVTGTKTVAGTFQVGGTVTYTVVLTNSGTATQPNNAGNEFSDVLPAGLTLVGAISTSGTATAVGNTVNWNGSLTAGASTTITITATINNGTEGNTISNQGTVSYDADLNGSNETSVLTDDPSVGGASDPTRFTVGGTALVTGTKSVTGSFLSGGAIVYTVVLTNSGTAPQADNPGDEFVDVLPAELELVSASASAGTAVATTATRTVQWNGTIGASGSVTITIHATINSGHEGETVSNQGTISFDSNGDNTNDATRLTDDPALPGASDPTSFVVLSGSFYTLTPCRLVDTRGANGPFGGPALAAGQERTFELTGQCDLPTTATAVALNVTVTLTGGDGFATLWPDGESRPLASTINFSAGQTRANNAVVKLDASGVLRVVAAAATHILIDVTGYFQ